MADETGWLIERADPKNPGCVLPDSFLGVCGNYDGRSGSGVFQWMTSANDALRFSRRKDAALVAGAIAMMQDGIVYGSTITGLRSGDPRPIIVEHIWSDPPVRTE